MGIFDFIKKPRERTFHVDYINKCGIPIRDCILEFRSNQPDCIFINGCPEDIGPYYVDKIGVSDDLKYCRIATLGFVFWVFPADAASVYSALCSVRSHVFDSLVQGIKSISFDDYLGLTRNFFERKVQFNIAGVSHSFGVSASSVISRLPIGSRLSFLFNKKAARDDERIVVCTSAGQQLGWFPYISKDSYIGEELSRQIEAGVDINAVVSETGRVHEQPYWWCAFSLSLRIPYAKEEPLVFVAGSGYLYHQSQTCNRKLAYTMPLSFALLDGKKPCSKCCSTRQT